MSKDRWERFFWQDGDYELQETDKKAASEPAPALRGKPLPRKEALRDWEITKDDIEEAQAWVDKAMKEAGFVD